MHNAVVPLRVNVRCQWRFAICEQVERSPEKLLIVQKGGLTLAAKAKMRIDAHSVLLPPNYSLSCIGLQQPSTPVRGLSRRHSEETMGDGLRRSQPRTLEFRLRA